MKLRMYPFLKPHLPNRLHIAGAWPKGQTVEDVQNLLVGKRVSINAILRMKGEAGGGGQVGRQVPGVAQRRVRGLPRPAIIP